jgi:pyridoxine 5-phosphate synthase
VFDGAGASGQGVMIAAPASRILLGVNIDHVATLRQARYRDDPCSPNAAPSPLEAALEAERAGADGITAHLREDRRHIQDADLFEIRSAVATKLNLEMGNSQEILGIVLRVAPQDVCLVPENRREVTTEGGLDCAGQIAELRPTVARLRDAGVRVSLFIDPEPVQIEAAAALEAEFIEMHTGAYANAPGSGTQTELERLEQAARDAHSLGLRVNAGHGLNYANVCPVVRLPHLVELNIGHAIVARAVMTGLGRAVQDMRALLQG